MSCYFRHIKDILAEAGIEVSNDNKKEVDRIIHGMVDVEYKNCSPTWQAVKEEIKNDSKKREKFINQLKKELKKIYK